MKPLLQIRLAAKLENLATLIQSLKACAREQEIGENRVPAIELGVEEAFVNICKYAYPNKEGNVEINCSLDDDRFVIEIIDEGIPFDINSLRDPDITEDLSRRRIGGLGVFFMKKMADDIQSRREGDRNILAIVIGQAKPKKT